MARELYADVAESSMTASLEGAGVRPPLVGSPTELPFRQLDSDRFDQLCRDIAKACGFADVHRYGKRGQAQHGVDFRGTSPEGRSVAFQSKQVSGVSASELEGIVQDFANGPLCDGTDEFVLCLSIEGNERTFQDKLDELRPQYQFPIRVWDSAELTDRLRDKESLVRTYFGQSWVDVLFRIAATARHRLNAEALLLGPVEALGLGEKAKEAEDLWTTVPADAARIYGEIAEALRERFPGHADRFEQLRANALRQSGDSIGSHDRLMALAIRDLFNRAQPQISSGVTHGLRELHDQVDVARQARAAAVICFGRWHEDRTQIESVAESFDTLEAGDAFAPYIATLLAEAALADRDRQLVLDREARLREAGNSGNRQVALRIRVALADSGVPTAWDSLTSEAESHRLRPAEAMYVSIRAARWCAWNGQQNRATTLYRQGMKLGAEANLDLDVENSLWSLTALYRFPGQFEEINEANQLALSIGGTRSFASANLRTHQYAYHYLATDKKPDAHLWARFYLLESIRSGCLRHELEAHTLLARIYGQSGVLSQALEHAVLGGESALVKELAPQIDTWPEFLAGAVDCPAEWVRPSALSGLEHVGDLAPPDLARVLVSRLLDQLDADPEDAQTVSMLLKALGAIILEATDEDLARLIPMLGELAQREPEKIYLTDAGVLVLAARIYRFRPSYRKEAASIFGEIAIGSHTNDWSHAIGECGDDTSKLIEAFERVSEREQMDLSGPFSDLNYVNDATRALWLQRIRSVSDLPLGPRSSHAVVSRYDVPPDFLREQKEEIIHEYVDKLVAIGVSSDEMSANRSAALAAAADVVDLLPGYKRRELVDLVWPLTAEGIQVSGADQFSDASLHPLSRFRISLGSAVDVRASAAWFLGKSASDPDKRARIVKVAVTWVQSDNPKLQHVGVLLLALPSLSTSDISSSELATHANPTVRRAALGMGDMQSNPDINILGRLASDPSRSVRIGVIYALSRLRALDADAYEGIRARLTADRSALIRSVAAEVLEPSD